MSSALTFSVAGMQAASDRLSIRARNVANVQTPGFKADDVVQSATNSGPVVSTRPSQAPVMGNLDLGSPNAAPSDVSLEYELSDMIMAEHAYKASASVVRTVAQLNDTLFDIFV